MKPLRGQAAFQSSTPQLALVAVDDVYSDLALVAHFNPKELQVDKSVPWSQPAGSDFLAYTTQDPRSLALELFFDSSEELDGHLEDELDTLSKMSKPRDPEARGAARLPPLLRIAGGPVRGFYAVLESVSIKVSMFDRKNRPVRATVQLKLKEVAWSYDRCGVLQLSARHSA
jgi:hypothetical protein